MGSEVGDIAVTQLNSIFVLSKQAKDKSHYIFHGRL